MKIFGGSSNIPLSQSVAEALGIDLSPLEIHIFPDGEKRVRVVEKVVDEACAVLQSCSTPVDQNYMEFFFIVDALKRSGAKSVTAVVPYLGYQRQDHIFRDGEAVSLEVVIKTLESCGVSDIIVYDLHSIKIPELFHIPLVHLSGLPLFAEKIKAENIEKGNTVLITPDMGGIRRIKQLSEQLEGMPYACIVKDRDLVTGGIEAKEIEYSGGVNDLSGRNAIVVDDMISSGGTIVKAVDLLKKKGVKKVYVFATHAIFAQNAPVLLQEAPIEKIFVTDTVFIPIERTFPKLEIISVAGDIAKTLQNR